MIAAAPAYRRVPAVAALALLLAAVAAGFLPVLLLGLGQGLVPRDPYLLRVTGFTLLQAGLSTALSILVALPVARALARRQFPGRGLVIRLFALPLALPAIVAVLGLVTLYGRGGWFGGLFDLYGLTGILLAHVFFNFPMAARMILARLAGIPPEYYRLGEQLGFGERHLWRLIEWPQLRSALPGIAVLVFLLCTASFTVVLTLGGGPAATTLEVAVYQALRFDFDPPRAVGLAIVQLAICAILSLVARRFGGTIAAWQGLRQQIVRHGTSGGLSLAFDATVIVCGLMILLPPLAAVAVSGIVNLDPDGDLAKAAATSLAIGAASAALSLALCWVLAEAAARSAAWRRLAGVSVLAGLIIPPAVLATGWFVLASRVPAVALPAPVLVVAMSALTATPFVFTILAPAVASAARQHDRLCTALGIAGLARLRVIDLPALRRPLGLAFLMAAIVSLGDLTAIMLFGSQDLVTLPALIYRQMGSYRMATAAGTAFILAALTFALAMAAETWGSGND